MRALPFDGFNVLAVDFSLLDQCLGKAEKKALVFVDQIKCLVLRATQMGLDSIPDI